MGKRTKKKRRGGKSGKSGSGGKAGSGGMMGSMRGGMKRVVGQGPKRKASSISKIVTWVLLVAALALLAYRLLSR